VSRALSWVLIASLFLLGAIVVVQQWRLDRAVRQIEAIEGEMRRLGLSEASKTVNGVTWTWYKGQGDWSDGSPAGPTESGAEFRRRVVAWCEELEK
jgi:hypothetical protein